MNMKRQDGETAIQWLKRLKENGVNEVGLPFRDYQVLLDELGAISSGLKWENGHPSNLADVTVHGMPIFKEERLWVAFID